MTKTVRGKYVVESGTKVSDVNEPAFELATGGAANAPQLTNHGAIAVTGSVAGGALVGVQVDVGLDDAQVFNGADGTLSVVSDDKTQRVWAVNFLSRGLLTNEGEIHATSKGGAAGIVGTDHLQVVNDGDLIVHGRAGAGGVSFAGAGDLTNTGRILAYSPLPDTTATGVSFHGDTVFRNGGVIKASGGEGADGVLLQGAVSHFYNSGTIMAEQFGEGYAVGLQIYAAKDGVPTVIDNTGVIQGGPAIHGGDADGITIYNEGRVIGGIEFVSSEDDHIYNRGRIDGGVYLGGGDDLYDGTRSRGSGIAYVELGSGKNTALGGTGAEHLDGGNGPDQLFGYGGDDSLAGSGGTDLLVGGKGADHFVYFSITDSTAAAPDVVKHLDNTDTIDVSRIDTDSQTQGDQGFTLVDHLDGHPAEAALAYDASADVTRLELDLDGDGQADSVVLIDGDHRDFANFVL